MPRVVIALGGNAFAAAGQPLTMAGQLQYAHQALSQLAPLLGLNCFTGSETAAAGN